MQREYSVGWYKTQEGFAYKKMDQDESNKNDVVVVLGSRDISEEEPREVVDTPEIPFVGRNLGRNLERFSAFMRDISGINGQEPSGNEQADNEKVSNEQAGNEQASNRSFCELPSQSSSARNNFVVLGKEFDNAVDAKDRVSSLLWMSYRCGFEPIPKSEDGPKPIFFFSSIVFNKQTLNNLKNLKSLLDNENFTSDAGWGCMIRTSQNLLANTMLKLAKSKQEEKKEKQNKAEDDKKQNEVDDKKQNEVDDKKQRDKEIFSQIIALFQDNIKSPFSLHNFIRVVSGSPLQIKPGQWFGPNAASASIKKLTAEQNEKNDADSLVPVPFVYVSENCDLYDDEIEEIFQKEKKPLLLLFPIRLGIDQVNKYYHDSILQLLASEYSVGIAGGKPSSSFYFLGYENDDELIYLDPHSPQMVEEPINTNSYHVTEYSKLNIEMLDPSMMIGILVKTMAEYQSFKLECTSSKNKILHFHPLVTVVPQESSITQSWEEVQGGEEEDFVNLNVKKNEEEFIDLGK
ncbi:ATG4 [Candida oxycetoniae]|uniref:Cysteine protease n=1 Tax=Candida oxycetoniae TaxID=497107 RepID=A0AAI9WYB8_9ASCO|nr:ATG4 [Candida oxycetoniae]KAI3404864.2 ATG4 [Candida oxycetoniae]